MSTAVAPLPTEIERVLIGGDLAQLKPEQRLSYYNNLCESLGLNPLTKPFQYLTLSGKTVLYATKDCTEQLRNNRAVSVRIVAREVVEGCYVVTAQASLPSGRCDESIGAVPIETLKGEARSNAMMKCETKAKRRVTLSICGLGMLDESEVDSIPGARPFDDGGSKEAQQEVAQRRIKELGAAAKEWCCENGYVGDGHACRKSPDPDYAERHKAIIMEANAVLDETVKEVEGKPKPKPKGAISFEALKSWGELKAELKKLTGTDAIYYGGLGAKGYEHANQIANKKEAMEIWKVLSTERTRLKGEVELKAVLMDSRERIGGLRFLEILGAHGAEGINDVLKFGGTPLSAVLAELKQAVDDLKVSV